MPNKAKTFTATPLLKFQLPALAPPDQNTEQPNATPVDRHPNI